MTTELAQRVARALKAKVDDRVTAFAEHLAHEAGASVVLFYGSNLRTGSLEGVLDFYVLLPGDKEPRIWPRVSYHERSINGVVLRAKVARMCLSTFAKAARGELTDTTIWARFVQPSALVWHAGDSAADLARSAISEAAITAARLAAALGPEAGQARDFWRALFRATYKAEFRVEKPGREDDILSVNESHFDGLLTAALRAGGIDFAFDGETATITPRFRDGEKLRILQWWKRRARLGKFLNFTRLVKASTTFEGAARYAAWKIERHSGMPVKVTPFAERYPLLAAPRVLIALWRHRRNAPRS